MTEDVLVADYLAGRSARQVATQHGVTERRVLAALRDAGVRPRRRGARPAADPELVRGRVLAGESLTSIAADLGVSVTAVAHAAQDVRTPATRRPASEWRDLTPTERRQLETAWRRLPRTPGLQVDWSVSVPVERFTALVRELHAAGVPLSRQGAALGVHGDYLRQTLRRRDTSRGGYHDPLPSAPKVETTRRP